MILKRQLSNPRFLIFLILLTIHINASAQNPIVTENLLPGTPQVTWDAVDGTGIQGYASEFSVNKGSAVSFKVDLPGATAPQSYSIKIYRIGYYQGNGARLKANLGNFTGSAQPAPLYDGSTGKYDCSNWTTSATWTVPASAVSGVYIAKLESNTSESMIFFIVRDDTRNADFLFKTSDATWQAYNKYSGNTFYEAQTAVPGYSHAVKVSYNRPMKLRGDKSSFFNAEYAMIRWMERNGYDVSYATDIDMARDASPFVPTSGITGTQAHKVLLSVGHDEYWSAEARTKFENARNAGVNLAFFCGNEIYWKVRWEDNYKTLVCYKEGTLGEYTCGGNCDPTNIWTGLWRDGCGSSYSATDGCNPEASLSGQISWTQSNGEINVPSDYKNYRFWRNTSVAGLTNGQIAEMPYGTLGNEWDPEQVDIVYPNHRIKLSYTEQFGYKHYLSLYKHSSGAWVFGAGTMQWSWGLDENHDLGNTPVSLDMQQATANLFKDFGLSAGSLQSGLINPVTISDNSAPVSTIISPVSGASVSGSFITIAGTSSDVGGGAVAGVEVSIDGGNTWKLAYGISNWSFSITTIIAGPITIKVRAWDDLSNLEVPGPVGSSNCITLNVTGPFSYSVFTPNMPSSTPIYNPNGSALELGMKFKSIVPGIITGVQYYKQAGSTGTRIGQLWSINGTLLGEATFVNETVSGWQQVSFPSPVSINANTTYIVSYFSSDGAFIVTSPFFNTPQTNGFLTGLADGSDGPNGLYIYSSTPAFPDQSVVSSNYWVDVLFAVSDLTPPEVTSVFPLNNATSVPATVHPTILLNEALDTSTVNTFTFNLIGPGNIIVPGNVSLVGNQITFTPSSQLALNSTYTVTLEGGYTGAVIKDLSGNALIQDYVWSFTTENYSAPSITLQPINQSACQNLQVTFNATAYGLPFPTVQWQKSSDNGITWTIIPGAISQVYSFNTSASLNNNLFRALFTNSIGTTSTTPALLTIIASTTGSINAVSQVICPGSPLMLQLSSAQGQSPYSLIVNGTTYSPVIAGQIFATIPTTESFWNNNITPSYTSLADPSSVELGIKFKSTSNGFINGIRFYKGAGNNGIHRGTLWSATGTQLATITFLDETAWGWQEALFSAPVAVTANTYYVASYFAPEGHYAWDQDYFINSPFTNGNFLQTPAYSANNAVGVYAYVASSAFPNNNPGPHNYWVDVIFSYPSNFTFNAQLTSISDVDGCTGTGNPMSSTSATIGSSLIPTFTASSNSNSCIDDIINYTTQPNQNYYIWSVSGSLNVDYEILYGGTEFTSNSVTIKWISTGNKSVSVNYSSGSCTGTSPAISITNVHAIPIPVISGSNSLCNGGQVDLNAGNFNSYQWSNGILTQHNIISNAGIYNVHVTDSYGCSATSAAFTVIENSSPAPVISVNGTPCSGNPIQLTTGNYSSYLWSNGAISSTITITNPGSYSVIVTNTFGCTGTSPSVNTASVNLPQATISGSTIICSGSSANITLNFTGNGPWIYAINGGSSVSTNINPTIISVNPTLTTTYNLTSFSDINCSGNISGNAIITVKGPLGTSGPSISTYPISGCVGNIINLGATPNSSATSYTWSGPAGSLFNGQIGPVTTTLPSVMVTLGSVPSGTGWTFCAKANNACNSTGTSCRFIRGVLSSPSAIIGNIKACPLTTENYSISAVSGAENYIWSGTNGITISGSGTSVQANIPAGFVSGNLCVAASLSCGYQSISKCITITNTLGTVGSITGAAQLCPGQGNTTYSIPVVTGASSYSWSLPAGLSIISGVNTNAIGVSINSSFTGGQLCVTANSDCGNVSAEKCKTLTIQLPAIPKNIVGTAIGICGDSKTFSVPVVSGALSYTWTVPIGATVIGSSNTNTITLSFTNSFITGQLCVQANNGCGSGGSRCLTLKGAPNKPVTITGSNVICAGQIGVTFSASATYGASSYTWTVPSGASITSGQGTANIIVNWGTSSGNITVKAGNSCGNSGTLTFAVSVNCRIAGKIDPLILFNVYPNPVRDKLNIEINVSTHSSYKLKLLDITGKVLKSETMNLIIGNNLKEIEVSDINKGVYILKIEENDFLIKALKIIID